MLLIPRMRMRMIGIEQIKIGVETMMVSININEINKTCMGNNAVCFIPYSEQGYCMRGELCPYDHGNDPVVMEDLALTQVLMFGPQGPPSMPLAPPGVPRPLLQDFVPPMSGPMPGMPPPPGVSPLPNALPPGMMMHASPPLMMRPPANMGTFALKTVGRTFTSGARHNSSLLVSEYSPDAPGINPSMNWGRPSFRGPRPVHPHQPGMGYNQGHRALISVPVESNSFHYKNSKAVAEVIK